MFVILGFLFAFSLSSSHGWLLYSFFKFVDFVSHQRPSEASFNQSALQSNCTNAWIKRRVGSDKATLSGSLFV